ncbi:RNA polymerase sigma factor [Streptomyces spiroverticillatus]|uniref:RNA polymerase sigma factor n=1 Tax=Streptomyces finlayi TaxID=67296 RepID=A0A918X0N3_9ACTN|nr:sigma-70 family RNA polymerase sigma factor [Streptomyces finlayi]GHA38708.1 RNA polymerase sigma factor [Streptomyces spiroverticillatus]GHD00813.1 RNA polymerase sigma factor [Streptomyces finlayi]
MEPIRTAAEGPDFLAGQFEANRDRLRGVAYRMLGSSAEAEDAVQEAWLRLGRQDPATIDNLPGWLTTVVARVCLDQLRSRTTRREDPLDPLSDTHVPDPILRRDDEADPEQQALLADSVGLALLVVLETLGPAERLAFVLHDMFAVPFEEIAPLVDRTPAATRQLASRARRRVQGTAPAPDTNASRQREVVSAFLAASRGGDFDGLLSLLDPQCVLRADAGTSPLSKVVRGAREVVSNALMFRQAAQYARPALVNGVPGLINVIDGKVMGVMDFTIVDGKILELNILADPDRLATLDVSFLEA